jgi:2-dehydro-3-deoxyphosphogluconate aldolase / (4S)-4-hydroxy-2-oxoglutarate aldolase
MKATREFFASHRVIPVVVIDDAAHALPLARALLAGGIRVIELTLRTPAALDACSAIARELPQMLLGLGTVLSAEDAARASDAGAKFLVSPGYTESIHTQVSSLALPWLAGAATASEVMHARDAGLSMLKLFPAEAVGGAKLLKAFSEVFSGTAFCPTGGITEESAASYLSLPNVPCLGGSWIASRAAIASADWAGIEARAQVASKI